MLSFLRKTPELVSAGEALPGRDQPIPTAARHRVSGRPLKGEVPEGMEVAVFGMGCFWGVERMFWQMEGVHVTAAGYAGGHTPNPTYEEVCTGRTGHTEAVRVVYDPAVVTFDALLRVFWEGHDPTQGMRQGNDVGTQYRSAIYTATEEQREAAERTRADYARRLEAAGYGPVTTEIRPGEAFYFAEDYHQQYLARKPGGYCGVAGTGVSMPAGADA